MRTLFGHHASTHVQEVKQNYNVVHVRLNVTVVVLSETDERISITTTVTVNDDGQQCTLLGE